MTDTFFAAVDTIAYEGPDSDNPLAFRWYDADRVVAGRTMAEHLRFAVCYWHSFNWDGSDIFGAGTLDRPWLTAGDPIEMAKVKMEAAFEFFEKLGVPFWCFHDVDIAPEGRHVRETLRQPRPDGRRSRRPHGAHRRQAAVGHRQPVLAPALSGRGGHQSRSGGVRLRRGAGRASAWRPPTGSAARTTCCGAAARATRRC